MKMDPARRNFLRTGACALGALLMNQESPAAGGPLARRVPKTGEASPGVGLGTWQVFDVASDAKEKAQDRETLKVFVELGGRVIDSSPMYGSSESVTGELAAALGVRAKLFVATKVWTSGRQAGIRPMEDSMRKLCVERPALMHAPNLGEAPTQPSALREWTRADPDETSREVTAGKGNLSVRTLYFLIFITLLNHSVFAGMRVSVSLYAIHLHATPFTVGVLMALYALLPMLSAVSMGRLIDRIGARVPMLVGSVAIALGALVPYLWPTLTALHLTSVLIGSGFMMYQVAAQNIIGYIGRPEDRPMTFSLAALGFSASGFVGPMLAGFGMDAFGHF